MSTVLGVSSRIAVGPADSNLRLYHLLLVANQNTEFCRWFRQGRFASIAEAWRRCDEPAWLLSMLRVGERSDEASLRRFAVRCARDTPIEGGRTSTQLLDADLLDALAVGERFADGKATTDELRDAHQVARMAEDAEARRKGRGRTAKWWARSATASALVGPGCFDANLVSLTIGKAAAHASLTDRPTHEAVAKRFHADAIRVVFGDPFAE